MHACPVSPGTGSLRPRSLTGGSGEVRRGRRLDGMEFSETVEVTGHLMDTGVLARILDDVLEYGADYAIERLDVGRTHDDESSAQIVVVTQDAESLSRLLMRLQAHGVNAVEPGAAVVKPAPRDGVFPDDFYSTTNLETVVRLGGSWVPVEHPEMDCGLLVSGSR